MSVLQWLRRYRLVGSLFILCLIGVLLVGSPGMTLPLAQSPVVRMEKSGSAEVTLAPQLTQEVRKTVLENGLTILTKEIHTAPVVSVQIWYRVGSRDETAGINGIAHQLEHLMFKGTRDRPIQFGRLFSALGSDSNAFTSYDMTAYFATVEQDKLPAMLVLEADRMRNALIDDKALASENRVVISELQGYENSPAYRLGRAVMRQAFPDSPYGLPVGGTKADVEKFTVEQVRNYYQRFYRPDNATLIVVGNFQTDQLLKQVRQSFGSIPKPAVPLPETPRTVIKPEIPATPRPAIVLREPGAASLLNAIYPLPNVQHPDVPALHVMDAILSSGRNSRLYQALVESGLATDAHSYGAHLIGTGWYEISATAAAGKAIAQIEQTLERAIADLQQKGVTPAELNRAKAQLKASTLLQNRSITSQAMQLGDDQISTGDYRFTDRLLTAIAQVTAADVQRVARTYLTPANRTVGWFEPTQSTGGTVGGKVSGATQTRENFSPGAPVDPAEVAKYLPAVPATHAVQAQPLPEKLTLANGLRILLLPDRSTPTIALSGHIQAGTAFDQPQTAGLASLTAENLMNGTKSRDYLAIARSLEDRGASLGFGANREGVLISGQSLAGDLPTLMQVLSDVLQNASFPDDQLELTRQQALTQLKLDLDNPSRVARRTFQQAVYPANHPFHTFPTAASLTQIQRQDLVQFHRQHYRPDATTLSLVGNFDSVQVRNLLNQSFGKWQDQGDPLPLRMPAVPLPRETVRLNPPMPGKTQSMTYLGYNSIDRRDPRYYPTMVLNQILGGDTLASRLGNEIRDRQGLTYGIYSYFQAGIYPGPFLVVMQTAPEDAGRAITSTITLLQQLRDQGVTAAEVEAAKRSLVSSYMVEQADPDSLSGTILMDAVYGLPLEELRRYPEKLRQVTPQQVNQAIQELLHPDRMVVVTAGSPIVGDR